MPKRTIRKGSVLNKSFSQKFWEDKHGNFVVWQKPNLWLWIWIVTLVLGWVVPYIPWVQKTIGWVSLIALIIWAVLEVTKGVNYFRRLAGLLVLLMLIVTRI